MSLSMLIGYVTSSPKYSFKCFDRTCFLRGSYPMSPLRSTWLSLNSFLKSKYVLNRELAAVIGDRAAKRAVPQMGMYLSVSIRQVARQRTYAVNVSVNHFHHRPYMTEGGQRIHLGIPTITMGVKNIWMALPPTGIPANPILCLRPYRYQQDGLQLNRTESLSLGISQELKLTKGMRPSMIFA